MWGGKENGKHHQGGLNVRDDFLRFRPAPSVIAPSVFAFTENSHIHETGLWMEGGGEGIPTHSIEYFKESK